MRTFLVVAILFAARPLSADCRDPLLSLDASGAVVAGTKEALRQHVRAGHPVRLYWSFDVQNDGRPEVQHWADATFLTEFENEIFAQVVEIRRQHPRLGTASVSLSDAPARWSALLGTNGVLEGAFDGPESTRTRHQVATSWCRIATPQDCTPRWTALYHHDRDGKPLAGSKQALLDAIRRGAPIRITWGMSARNGEISVEHVAEPVFVTIMNGEEVAAQLPEHVAQKSYWNAAEARLDDPAVLWRGLMSTTGDFDAVMVHRGTGEVVRRLPQKARLAWHAFTPAESCSAAPPELRIPEGVVRKE